MVRQCLLTILPICHTPYTIVNTANQCNCHRYRFVQRESILRKEQQPNAGRKYQKLINYQSTFYIVDMPVLNAYPSTKNTLPAMESSYDIQPTSNEVHPLWLVKVTSVSNMVTHISCNTCVIRCLRRMLWTIRYSSSASNLRNLHICVH